jgi:hypothetical protein
VQLLLRSSSSIDRLFELFSNFSFASFLSYARVCIPHSGYVRAAPQHFSSHDSLSFYRFGQDLNILEQQYPLDAVNVHCSIFHSSPPFFLRHFFSHHVQACASLNAVIEFASVLHLVGPAMHGYSTVRNSHAFPRECLLDVCVSLVFYDFYMFQFFETEKLFRTPNSAVTPETLEPPPIFFYFPPRGDAIVPYRYCISYLRTFPSSRRLFKTLFV